MLRSLIQLVSALALIFGAYYVTQNYEEIAYQLEDAADDYDYDDNDNYAYDDYDTESDW